MVIFHSFLYVYQRVTSRKPTTSTIAIHHHLRLCVRHVFWPQLQPIVDATGRLVMAGDATGGFTKIRVFQLNYAELSKKSAENL